MIRLTDTPIFSKEDKELLQRKLKVYAELLSIVDKDMKKEIMYEMQRLGMILRSMG